VTAKIIAGEGDLIPVSAFPVDGTYPVGTTQWEKRNIALEMPVWDPETCIQCGNCVYICPHAVIRSKVYSPDLLADAPSTFKSVKSTWRQFENTVFTLQVSPEDCTGCGLCVHVCPAKNKKQEGLKAINMTPQPAIREEENTNWEFFLKLPEVDRAQLTISRLKDLQLIQPLFEFSGACAGCGETPYVKLLSQLFGDRAFIGNATGCSSIYGGNLPTTPWTTNKDGRGPTWSNSLFEDNAEFAMGMRLALDKQIEFAHDILARLSSELGDELIQALINADQSTEAGLFAQRERVKILRQKLEASKSPEAKILSSVADALVKKSVWALGGDGWAYDIGYGGLDHVIASGRNVNILVLDTEVYSNTGGQMSKSTPSGAVAKFAAGGKLMAKKDLAMMAMIYNSAYVARVAMGANTQQTIRAFIEAEAYNGPSIIIAYSHCINHGYDITGGAGIEQQKAAVNSGHWILMRYNPDLVKEGKNPLTVDSKAPSLSLDKYVYNEPRYNILARSKPEVAKQLLEFHQKDINLKWNLYQTWAAMQVNGDKTEDKTEEAKSE
ncbi:MAG: pyruvate-ferredoxin/flavodoxin oxidoreductase, partial [Candidatus Poribacteria bacterium]|nr:pyruvate-ferredoxin/flavodoxin oxidoreductase [Candidatus Poribacteria bacterium]